MAERYVNNSYPINGIIYEIRRRPWKSAKGEGEFVYIKLEVTRSYYKTDEGGGQKLVTIKEIPEFRLGWGVNIEDYTEGDFVELTFSLRGKYVEYKDRNSGEKKRIFINENEVTFMKFGILDDGKVAAPLKPRKPLSPEEQLTADTFKGAEPQTGFLIEDEDELPF